MKPWRVRSEHSDAIDLTLDPIVVHRARLNLGVIGTGVLLFWVRIEPVAE